jgi:glycerol-3-phosphate acyltransferase PlsY
LQSPIVLIVVLAISFLLGSLPSGVIIGKCIYHVDIREVGSGNIGTTNAIRAFGKKGGYLVFLMDFGKGLLAGLLAMLITSAFASAEGMFTTGDAMAMALAGGCLGHVFSPWLGFHGGKGIAVSIGALFFVFGPIPALIELASFIVVVVLTKYISAGSITAAVLCPFMSFYVFWGDWFAAIVCALVGILVVWAHRANISRLRAGTENRIGSSKRG